MKFKKIYLAYLVLFIVLFTFLWKGPGGIYDHKLEHGFPMGYLASDTFQHLLIAEGIKELGDYRIMVPYIVSNEENAMGYYPPVFHHMAVIFSHVSGLELYDAMLFLPFILTLFGITALFAVLVTVNKDLAILSLPFSLFIIAGKNVASFTWGYWPALCSFLFVISSLIVFLNINKKNMWVLMAVLLSGIILTHTIEMMYFSIFFGLYFILLFFMKRKDFKKEIRPLLLTAFLALIISFDYLVIFFNTYFRSAGTQLGEIATDLGGTPFLALGDFGFYVLFFFLGLAYSMFLLKNNTKVVVFFLSLLIASYSNYLLLGSRALHLRFYWPIFIAVFFGLGIYFVLDFLSRFVSSSRELTFLGAGFLLIFLIAGVVDIPNLPSVERLNPSSMTDQYHWQMFNWFHDKPEDTKILFVYGDAYNQDSIIQATKRLSFLIKDTNIYFNFLKEKMFDRFFNVKLSSQTTNNLPYRKSFFRFGYIAEEKVSPYFVEPASFRSGTIDLCTMDFLVLDTVSRYEGLADANKAIVSTLIDTGNFEISFQNPVSVVLANVGGEECMPWEGIEIG